MRTTDRIGFKLIIKEPDTAERTIVVCPRYDGLKMKWQRESGNVYHTLDFEGNLEFWGVDFVTLLNCPLQTVFELVVFLKGRGEVGRSEFRKTDCEWNLNDGWCKVDISTYDKYSKINDHKGDEFNLVKIIGHKKTLKFNSYPTINVYAQHDNKTVLFRTNGGIQVNVEDDDARFDDLQNMKFGRPKVYAVAYTPATYGTTIEPFGGVYVGTFEMPLNGQYEFDLRKTTPFITDSFKISIDSYGSNIRARVVDLDGTETYNRVILTSSSDFMDAMTYVTSATMQVPSINGKVYRTVEFRFYNVYERILTRQYIEENLISSDDIYRSQYKSALEKMYANCSFSKRTSATDTGYGIVANTDRYYNTPDDEHEWFPVYQESWFRGVSFWIGENYILQTDVDLYKSNEVVNDFYLFTDAVRAVIQKIDPTIVFEANDSHFLFDNPNPLPTAKPQGPLYISQKSNVLNLGYDYPAWQAPIKWSQIETFLKNALGCYWDLYEDANGVTHLRIEHQSFYDNGGTYNPQGNPSASIDLLHNRFDVATRQPQAFHTNHWKWDVDGNGLYSSACRYEYGWMDTQSAIFDGETVEVPEEYRLFTDDKTEERKVDWFSSDIDFLTAVQAECSSDGFVVVMESYTNPGWIVSGNENYSGQNYQLSFEYLQPLYLVYGIYAEKVQIGDGDPFQTTSNARMRTSEVSFNLLEGEWVEPSDILLTEVGNGVIDTLTYDMSSEKWTATVRYNNE